MGGFLSEGGLGRRAGGSCDADRIWITWVSGDVNPVTGRKEGIETLDEGGVAPEEHGYALDDAGRVDPKWYDEAGVGT